MSRGNHEKNNAKIVYRKEQEKNKNMQIEVYETTDNDGYSYEKSGKRFIMAIKDPLKKEKLDISLLEQDLGLKLTWEKPFKYCISRRKSSKVSQRRPYSEDSSDKTDKESQGAYIEFINSNKSVELPSFAHFP